MKASVFSLILLLFFVMTDCSPGDDNRAADSFFIESVPGTRITFEDNNSLAVQKDLILELIRETAVQINGTMKIEDLHIRIGVNPDLIIREIGIGGFNPSANEVVLAIDPDRENLAAILQKELPPMLAHEVHHAKRRRSVGYGSTLLEAMISEGLADQFSIEITGIVPPPWSSALQADELEIWLDKSRTTWDAASYNHSEWFFGRSTEIPRWAGYSIGFYLVELFLEAHPQTAPSDLHDEPADSFRIP